MTSDTAKLSNETRSYLMEFFGGEANLQCFALKKPFTADEPDRVVQVFATKSTDLFINLKQSASAKLINGRHLTGNMFLNLTLEYVDALNANE